MFADFPAFVSPTLFLYSTNINTDVQKVYMILLIYKSHLPFYHLNSLERREQKMKISTIEAVEMVQRALDPHNAIGLDADSMIYASLTNRLISLFEKPEDVEFRMQPVTLKRFAESITKTSGVRDCLEDDPYDFFEQVDDGVYTWKPMGSNYMPSRYKANKSYDDDCFDYRYHY